MSSRPISPAPPRDERPFRVLRFRDFRVIWTAELFSQTGTQIQRVAVAWQVFELTGDPFQLGLLGLVRLAPLLVFGLAGGVMADRYDRRRMLVLTQVALMVIAAAFAGLTATGAITLPWIYGLTALSALFGAISGPTRHALIPTLVPSASMPAAMTMAMLTVQASGMVGPALGGVLLATIGIAAAYAVDAISFGIVAIASIALRARPERPAPIGSGRAAAVEGLRFLWESPILLATMLLDFVANFFGASTTLMPIFAAEILGGGPSTLGLLLSAPAVGSVAAATILASRRPLARPGRGILGAIVVYGLSLTFFALSRELWLSLIFLATSGAADSVSMTQRHTLRNLLTPDHLRGRVAAAHSTFAGGGPQLGEFEAGVVASWTGAPAAVAIGGIGTVLAAFFAARSVPDLVRFQWQQLDPNPVATPGPQTETEGAKHIDEQGLRSI